MNRKNHYLLQYLEQYNRMSRLFGEKPPITLEDCKREEVYMDLFLGLNNQLSPENLCCDGELRGRALATKAKMLNGAWLDLSKLTGTSFEEDDRRLFEYADKKREERDCPKCGHTSHMVYDSFSDGKITFNCPNCGDYKVNANDIL